MGHPAGVTPPASLRGEFFHNQFMVLRAYEKMDNRPISVFSYAPSRLLLGIDAPTEILV
jgi:hypothetical protein